MLVVQRTVTLLISFLCLFSLPTSSSFRDSSLSPQSPLVICLIVDWGRRGGPWSLRTHLGTVLKDLGPRDLQVYKQEQGDKKETPCRQNILYLYYMLQKYYTYYVLYLYLQIQYIHYIFIRVYVTYNVYFIYKYNKYIIYQKR